MKFIPTCLAVCLIAAPTPARAQDAPLPPANQPLATPVDASQAPVSPSGEPVTRIIVNLDHSNPDVRHAAALRLNSLGGEALPAVEAALQGDLTSAESKIRLEAAAKILRARARIEKLSRQRIAWKHRQFFEGYQKHGRTHPEWDGHVKTGIENFLKVNLDPDKGPAEPRRIALEAFEAARKLGCEDALVRFMHQLLVGQTLRATPDPTPVFRSQQDNVYKLFATDYPPVVKFWAVWRCIRISGIQSLELCQSAAMLVPKILATPDLPANELDVGAEQLYDAVLSGTRFIRGYNGFLKAYTDARPGAPGPLVIKARMRIDEALLPGGFGPRNDPGGLLAEAQTLLEDAYKIDPNDPRAATLMILVKTHLGDPHDNREAVETWFARAMDASPDNRDACKRKLAFLLQSFDDGTRQDVLEFGRWCLKTQNWRGGIPFILADAHEALSKQAGDRKEYFAREDVWQDMRGVYEGCVLNFPDAALQRTQYARVAAQCGKWDIAHAQLHYLGDRAIPEVFGGQPTFNYYKRKAQRLAPATAPPK